MAGWPDGRMAGWLDCTLGGDWLSTASIPKTEICPSKPLTKTDARPTVGIQMDLALEVYVVKVALKNFYSASMKISLVKKAIKISNTQFSKPRIEGEKILKLRDNVFFLKMSAEGYQK